MHPPHEHMPPMDFDGVDPLAASVLAAFRKTMHLNRQFLMKSMAETGGHPGQAGCLRVLAFHDGISQRDLAEMLHLSRPTVTAMLQKMEADGFIERWDDADDQRLTRIRLTPAGHARGEELRSSYEAYVSSTVGAMTPDDQREFARLLNTLADITAAALNAPAGPEDGDR